MRAVAVIALCSSITCVGAENSSERPGSTGAPAAAQSSRPGGLGRAGSLPVGLADTLRAILQARNPVISRVAFREIRSINYGRYYYAIGWGVRADMTFSGSFEDELFAIVRIDSSLARITGVLDLIPSPRWLDYTFEIDAITGDSLIVAGRGDTYGDGPQRRAYARPEAQ